MRLATAALQQWQEQAAQLSNAAPASFALSMSSARSKELVDWQLRMAGIETQQPAGQAKWSLEGPSSPAPTHGVHPGQPSDAGPSDSSLEKYTKLHRLLHKVLHGHAKRDRILKKFAKVHALYKKHCKKSPGPSAPSNPFSREPPP